MNPFLYNLIYKYFSYTQYRVLTKDLGLKQCYADIGGQKKFITLYRLMTVTR